MSLQSLREQALARTRTALLRRQVVLDEALDKAATEARQHATDARNRVVLHEVEQDRDEPGGRYSDAPEGGARLAALEAAAVDAEQAAEDAERDAAPEASAPAPGATLEISLRWSTPAAVP